MLLMATIKGVKPAVIASSWLHHSAAPDSNQELCAGVFLFCHIVVSPQTRAITHAKTQVKNEKERLKEYFKRFL